MYPELIDGKRIEEAPVRQMRYKLCLYLDAFPPPQGRMLARSTRNFRNTRQKFEQFGRDGVLRPRRDSVRMLPLAIIN